MGASATPEMLDAARNASHQCARLSYRMTDSAVKLERLLIEFEIADLEDFTKLQEQVVGIGSMKAPIDRGDFGTLRHVTYSEIPDMLLGAVRQWETTFPAAVRNRLLLNAPANWGPFASLGGRIYSTAHEAAARGLEMSSNSFRNVFDHCHLRLLTPGRERAEYIASLKATQFLLDPKLLEKAIDEECHRAGGSNSPERLAITPANSTCPDGNRPTFLRKVLMNASSLRDTSFNGYCDKSGVQRPGKGKRNHRFTFNDAIKIMQTIANNSSEADVVNKCNSWLEQNHRPR